MPTPASMPASTSALSTRSRFRGGGVPGSVRAQTSSSMVGMLKETVVFARRDRDRKSTRLNSSHLVISYAVFCLKKKKDTAHVSQRALDPTPTNGPQMSPLLTSTSAAASEPQVPTPSARAAIYVLSTMRVFVDLP